MKFNKIPPKDDFLKKDLQFYASHQQMAYLMPKKHLEFRVEILSRGNNILPAHDMSKLSQSGFEGG